MEVKEFVYHQEMVDLVPQLLHQVPRQFVCINFGKCTLSISSLIPRRFVSSLHISQALHSLTFLGRLVSRGVHRLLLLCCGELVQIITI